MAIHADSLTQTRLFIDPIRIQDGNFITLDLVAKQLQQQANEKGIPVAFRKEQLQTGSFFNKQFEDILYLYNPDFPGYITFIIRITYQGNYAFLEVYNYGGSVNYRHENTAAKGSLFRDIANSFSNHKEKLKAENQYYAILKDCFQDALGQAFSG